MSRQIKSKLLLVALLVWTPKAEAEPVGSLRFTGTVIDPSGESDLGPRIEGALLSFTHESGRPAHKTRTAADGRYTIDLPYGRYKILVEAAGYLNYRPKRGFLVSRPRARGIYNVMMKSDPSVRPQTGAWIHTPIRQKWRDQEDHPPIVKLSAKVYDLEEGETIEVTVSATDDHGLSKIWGGCRGCPVSATTGPVVRFEPGARAVNANWRFSPPETGDYAFWINARDTSFGVRKGEIHQASEGVGSAWARVRVHPKGALQRTWMGR